MGYLMNLSVAQYITRPTSDYSEGTDRSLSVVLPWNLDGRTEQKHNIFN
jgi:hypothetical protein